MILDLLSNFLFKQTMKKRKDIFIGVRIEAKLHKQLKALGINMSRVVRTALIKEVAKAK